MTEDIAPYNLSSSSTTSAPSSHPATTATTPSSDPNTLPPEALAFATRIFNAARTGDLPIFQQALPAGLPPNMTNDKGDSLIMLASYHGHLPLVRLLLSFSADPNSLNDRGQSPLAGAVFKNESEVVDALLGAGADPDAGQPSAKEAVGMFGMEGRWGARFEEARKKREEGRLGGGREEGGVVDR